MAFNQNQYISTNYFSSYLNNYPNSDSDDQLKPRDTKNIGEFFEPEYPQEGFQRSGSKGSLSSDDSVNQDFQRKRYMQRRGAGRPQSSDEEVDIPIPKVEENELITKGLHPAVYQNHQQGNVYFSGGAADYDNQYCADVEMKEEPDYLEANIKREEQDMQIESEGLNIYSHQTEGNEEELTSMYESMGSESESMRSQRSHYPADDSYMIKREPESNSNMMMIETGRNEDYYQQLQMSLRRNALRVREAIESVLQNKQLKEADYQGLNVFERHIINCIIEKKLKAAGAKNSKRREEKQKLFFKSALKHIETNFMQELYKNLNITRKKDIDPTSFYYCYFEEVARSMQLDIYAFIPPCQKRKFRAEAREMAKSELKSFNLKYIELILSSKRFMAETIEYLENDFVQNYTKSRYQKIDKVLQNITSVLEQGMKEFSRKYDGDRNNFVDIMLRRISDALLNNSKSKLPWSDAELDEAREFARLTIEKVSKNIGAVSKN